MPRPYILEVHSRPTKVSEEIWEQWYLEEHIRDMVYHKFARTGAFYRSSSELIFSGAAPNDGSETMRFYALYQTDQKYRSDPEIYPRKHSGLWDADMSFYDVGEFRLWECALVEVLGSYEYNEDVAPHIIHAKVTGEEVESKIQFEHVNAVSILDGYRRTLLYRQVGPVDALPSVILIHEFEALDSGHLPSVKIEMEAIEPTKDCIFQLRSFELLDSEGFGGRCREPMRLEQRT